MTKAPREQPERAGAAGKGSQLSGKTGVSPNVSSAAMDAGLAAAHALPQGRRDGMYPAGALPDYSALSDAEVMLRVSAGDDAAFDHLVAKFRRPIVQFMYRMARNQAVAEELAQEAFLRVYRARNSYAATASFSTWLYRIATNLAVNHARDTRHERGGKMVSLDEPGADTGATLDLPHPAPTAEQEMLRRERLAAIRRHVEALPERQRLAVFMHKYQGLDYRAIGKVLKLSESATKSLLFRAYETLRERLKDFV
jgi:RNA polymerase sigma-70 factor (ECF subfamily)